MSDHPDDFAPPPPPPASLSPRRWARWAVFAVIVGAAAVAARNAAESDVSKPPEAPEYPARDSVTDRVALGEIGLEDRKNPGTVTAVAQDGDASGAVGKAATLLDRSYRVDPGAEVDVEIGVGDVEAVQASGDMLRVVVQLRPGAPASDVSIREQRSTPDHVKLSVEPEGSRKGLSIFGGHVRFGLSGGRRGARAIDRVRLEIPEGVRLSLSTGAGDVRLTGLSADVRLETGAGDIDCGNLSGRIEIASGAGDVTVSNTDGAVSIETGAGDVRIDGLAGRIDVATGAGSIEIAVDVAVAGEIDLETGMGSIDVRVPSVERHVHAETGMGSISVSIAGGGFELDAESGMGSVVLRTDGQEERSGGMGGELRRRVNGGGPTIRLESGAGSIDVKATGGSSVTAG